jgi:hypothetical protein
MTSIEVVDHFAMSVDFPANFVRRGRQQSIWRVLLVVADIREAP